MSTSRDGRSGTVKGTVVFLAALVVGCSSSSPTGPVGALLVVRGTVVSSGARLDGATVILEGLPSLLGPGPKATGRSDAQGRFEVRMGGMTCGRSLFLGADRPGYVFSDATGWDGSSCPGVVEGVTVRMEANPTLLITTTELLPAAVGAPYQDHLEASGGDDTFAWYVHQGDLPPGIGLAGGSVSGVPDSAGSWSFTVRVEDGAGAIGLRDLDVVVHGGVVVKPKESCAAQPDSAVVTFASSVLHRAVRAATGVGGQEALTCGAVSTVTSLDVSAEATTGGALLWSFAGIQNLSALVELDAYGQRYARDHQFLSALTALQRLDVGGNWEMANLDWVGPLRGLVELGLHMVHYDAGRGPRGGALALDGLASLTSLVTLDLSENYRIGDVAPLAGLTSLAELRLGSNDVSDLTPLSALAELVTLDLSYNEVQSTDGLEGMTQLARLGLANNPVVDVSALSGLQALVDLDLSSSGRVLSDISPLSGLTALKRLDLAASAVSDIGPLSGLTQLTYLGLGYSFVSDLSALAGLTSLDTLSLYANPAITDVGPLRDLEALTELDLERASALADITPLVANAGLGAGDRVGLTETGVPCGQVDQLRSKSVTVDADCHFVAPTLVSPVAAAVLDNGCVDNSDPLVWDFDWTDVPGAFDYDLLVQGPMGLPLISRTIGSAESEYHHETTGYVADTNRTGWRWSVRALFPNGQSPFSIERGFSVEALGTDCP